MLFNKTKYRPLKLNVFSEIPQSKQFKCWLFYLLMWMQSINTITLHQTWKYFKSKKFFPNKNKHAGSWLLTFFRFFGLLLKLVESHHQLLFLPLHLLFLSLYGLSSLLLTLQLSSADKTQPKRSTVTFASLYPHTKLISHTVLPKVLIVPWPAPKTACSEIFMVSWCHNHEQIDIGPLMFTYQCLFSIQHLGQPFGK